MKDPCSKVLPLSPLPWKVLSPWISCCAYASIIMHFNLVHVLTLYNLNHSLASPMEIGLFVNIYIGLVPIQATSPYLSWSILTNQLPKHLNDIFFNLIYSICTINPLLWFASMIFMFNMTIRIMFNSIVGAQGWTWTPNHAFVPKYPCVSNNWQQTFLTVTSNMST